MAQSGSTQLKLMPLDAQHRARGARMVPFAGWDMPAEYSGASDEHLAIRTRAGLSDISHGGQIEIAGSDALAAVQWISSNDASRLEVGQSHRAGLLTPAGTFVDAVVVYRFAQQHFLLVVNASNVAKDLSWIVDQTRHVGDVIVLDTSARYALLALEGPDALVVMQRVAKFDPSDIEPDRFAHGEVAGVRATLSRTGSTGEDGFEIFVPPKQSPVVWNAILDAGQDENVIPVGLAARDSLRLEAGMRAYGHEIDETTTAIEAGLESIVGWNKGAFVGRDALLTERASGTSRGLVGFEIIEGAIATPGSPVLVGGQKIGAVTSGAQAPFLNKSIGMAYVLAGHTDEGGECVVEIDGRQCGARVVALPFYQRPKG